MDQNRLKDVQQTDLAESRVNEDFVLWLKTKGMNWLLVILIAICAYMGWNYWLDRQVQQRNQAWIDLTSATIPPAWQDVAARYPDTDSVQALAELFSADAYLSSIRSGTRYDREPTAEDYQLDDQTREQWLDQADMHYDRVFQIIGSAEPDEFALKALVIPSLYGRAAIAESRGDFSAPRDYLSAVIVACKPEYEDIAAQAEARLDSMDMLASPLPIPMLSDLPEREQIDPMAPPVIGDILDSIINPEPAPVLEVQIEEPAAEPDADGQPAP